MAHQRHKERGDTGAVETVRVRLLGGFSVSVGGRTVEGAVWRRRKAAGVMKLLSLARGHRLHRERIVVLLWPDLDSRQAANNFHRALHFARRAFEPDAAKTTSRYLSLSDDVLALCPEGPLWVDVDAFEGAVAVARRAREPAAYRAALALYAGELLPEDRYEEWVSERREALRETYLALLVELAELHEERREHGQAVESLRLAMAEEPAREALHRALMRLYAARGERRQAMAQYERLEKALAGEPDATTRRLYQEIRTGGYPVSDAATPGRRHLSDVSSNNLPASLTSFVGREGEIMEVERALSMTRLMTLSGAGGSGKTRLALEVARDMVGVFPDGVWLVQLAPLSDATLVPRTVAQALDVRGRPDLPLREALAGHLRAKDLLLVLDNCEHLTDAVAHLAKVLLGACPKLRVLATSRESLGVPGETIWKVPPLSLPDETPVSSPEDLLRYEAVRLFVDRTRSRQPGFELLRENAGAVAGICRKLDGIPLAIELATARMGTLAVDQVAERLERSLGVLGNGGRTAEPRHRTMRAALDWSYGLLDEPERRLFGRLSVFAGGWTLEAAEEVCSDGVVEHGDVLELLSRLVDKSLVVAEAGRFRMLEPVRQYALEMLEERGELVPLGERHAAFFLSLAERAEPELVGPEPAPWLAALEREVGNLRAALSWALDGAASDERVETGLRLANALARFWDTHGPAEGRRWFEKGLARDAEVSPAVRARALGEAGFIAVYEWDPRSIGMLREAFGIYRELGDRDGILLVVEHLGHALGHHATPEAAAPIVAEVEALLGDSEDRNMQARYLTFLGFAAEVEHDHEETRLRWKEALAIYREVGDAWNVARCLPSLGMITLSHHDVEEAAGYFEEGLVMERDVRYKTIIFFHLNGLAAVATHRGHLRRAAKLYGATEKLRESEGFSLAALRSSEYDYEGYVATVRAGLDDAALEAAWGEGRALSPKEAVEYALSDADASRPAVRGSRATSRPLTRREQEIAELIGRGLGNREIAAELGITVLTAQTHVSRILRKLGFRSRTEIAAWTLRQGAEDR